MLLEVAHPGSVHDCVGGGHLGPLVPVHKLHVRTPRSDGQAELLATGADSEASLGPSHDRGCGPVVGGLVRVARQRAERLGHVVDAPPPPVALNRACTPLPRSELIRLLRAGAERVDQVEGEGLVRAGEVLLGLPVRVLAGSTRAAVD